MQKFFYCSISKFSCIFVAENIAAEDLALSTVYIRDAATRRSGVWDLGVLHWFWAYFLLF